MVERTLGNNTISKNTKEKQFSTDHETFPTTTRAVCFRTSVVKG